MKIVTVSQMREVEQHAAQIGLPSEVLMDNAGRGIALQIEEWLGDVEEAHILFLIGPGNNGGDGLVAAHHLYEWGAKISVYLAALRAESDANYQEIRRCSIPIFSAQKDKGFAILDTQLSSAEIVVDALFGTGKARPMEGIFAEMMNRVESARVAHPELKVVAVDLPSGLDADTGVSDPACVRADLTITLACPKKGLFIFPGAEKIGELRIVDIGIPPELTGDIPLELIMPEEVRAMLPQRPPWANKGTFGRVMVVAGSINYIGAAYLACNGAARIGAGLVTLATPYTLLPILASKLTEVTYAPLPEAEPGIIAASATLSLQEQISGASGYNTLLIGCGLGQKPEVVEFIKKTLFELAPTLSLSLVVDADGLNALSQVPHWWERMPSEAILTPHPGEMSRLCKLSVEEIQQDRIGVCCRMAEEWQKVVVLKGAFTVVAAPDGRAMVCNAANPGLASAGTGDVLAGAIAGLVAQGMSCFDAAVCGVYLHSRAAEQVAKRIGDAGMLAGDLLPELPLTVKMLKRGDVDYEIEEDEPWEEE